MYWQAQYDFSHFPTFPITSLLLLVNNNEEIFIPPFNDKKFFSICNDLYELQKPNGSGRQTWLYRESLGLSRAWDWLTYWVKGPADGGGGSLVTPSRCLLSRDQDLVEITCEVWGDLADNEDNDDKDDIDNPTFKSYVYYNDLVVALKLFSDSG